MKRKPSQKMKYHLVLFLILIITLSVAQPSTNSKISGTRDSVYSTILKEKRKIFVYIPTPDKLYGSEKIRYPVVYLLDPEDHFNSVTEMIKELSVTGALPQLIVVGIANTDRTRDLTPTHVKHPFYHDKIMGFTAEGIKTSGGGEKFTAFIETELIPHVDSLYPTAPYRIFIGHSFGGLTVANTIFNHANLFNAYIAIDPSFWWDNQKTLKQIEKDVIQKKFDNKTLYLAIANVKPSTLDTLQAKKDTTPNTLHIRSNFLFNEFLNRNKQNRLLYRSKYYDNDDHSSVHLIAAYDGLRFIFKDYRPNLPYDSKTVVNANIDSALTVHFNNVSKRMGYTFVPPLMLINNYGYMLLSFKNVKQAHKLFQRNIDNYPTSFFVYDSMGDYYNAMGEKEKAMEFYKKTLTLFDFPETKEKLEKLNSGK